MLGVHHTSLRVRRGAVVGRRDFLAGVGASTGLLAWTDLVSLKAAELRRQGRACILLWMQGGPSQFETFDPKPGHANGGPTQVIDTNVPGIRIASTLPKLAQQMDKLALVRSMTTKEGNHQRATYLMHTSYVPMASINYPTLGSVAAREALNTASELPSFVRIGRSPNSGGGGYLGTQFDPFIMPSAMRLPDNVNPATNAERFERRLTLRGRLEEAGAEFLGTEQRADHALLLDRAARMVMSPDMQAFDVTREPDAVRDAYGRSEFGTGCLLARRLVEHGVTFVEVTLGGWDTHQNNADATARLGGQLDQPFAQLLQDLSNRGLLDSTLVVWMGEFGRTPRINARSGRDHFPRVFSGAVAGAGVRGGQVIGASNESGEEVADLPVSEKDWFQSIYHALRVDARRDNMTPIGRPIKFVDGGAPVMPLFG